MISIGELKDAAMVLRKRNNENSLKLAALIARKAGAEELTLILACQCVKQSLLVGNLTVANEVVSQYTQFKVNPLLGFLLLIKHFGNKAKRNNRCIY